MGRFIATIRHHKISHFCLCAPTNDRKQHGVLEFDMFLAQRLTESYCWRRSCLFPRNCEGKRAYLGRIEVLLFRALEVSRSGYHTGLPEAHGARRRADAALADHTGASGSGRARANRSTVSVLGGIPGRCSSRAPAPPPQVTPTWPQAVTAAGCAAPAGAARPGRPLRTCAEHTQGCGSRSGAPKG